MYKLQKLNVIRIVETEYEKADLIKQGFKEVIEKTEDKKVKKGKD
jgi:hypothetical protein